MWLWYYSFDIAVGLHQGLTSTSVALKYIGGIVKCRSHGHTFAQGGWDSLNQSVVRFYLKQLQQCSIDPRATVLQAMHQMLMHLIPHVCIHKVWIKRLSGLFASCCLVFLRFAICDFLVFSSCWHLWRADKCSEMSHPFVGYDREQSAFMGFLALDDVDRHARVRM